MKNFSVRVLLTCLLVLLGGPLDVASADGPYSGKVIDAETKEPIEGAVVVFVWMKRVNLLVQNRQMYEAAKETMTDKNGEFKLSGYTLTNIFAYFGVQPPWIIIFKPGYGDFPWHRAYPPRGDKSRNLLEYFGANGLVELPKMNSQNERFDVLMRLEVPEEAELDPSLSNYRKLVNIEEVNLEKKPSNWKKHIDLYLACENKVIDHSISDADCSGTNWEKIIERYREGCKNQKGDPFCDVK